MARRREQFADGVRHRPVSPTSVGKGCHARFFKLGLSLCVCLALGCAALRSASGQPRARYEPVLRIGSLDGPPSETFGWIADMATDSRANVFVLDAQAPEIRWFDSTGTYRGSVGRKGAGPG